MPRDATRPWKALCSRRGFLATSAGVAVTHLALPARHVVGAAPRTAVEIIDTHAYLGHWPFRQTAGNTPAETIAALRRGNVVQGWAGTFEGLLHKDVSGANARLAEACRREGEGLLAPFGSVNPTLPDWEEDVRRCHEAFKMSGIRLHPNYHGYTLDDERFVRLLSLAAQRKLIVQLVAALDDEVHAYLRLPSMQVDLRPLAAVVKRFPESRLTLHSRSRRFDADRVGALVMATNVYFDASAIADPGGAPADRMVLGSSWPLGTIESAVDRAFDAAATDAEARAIGYETAHRLFRAASDDGEAVK
jgi:predicted TIM-barrel fold metal-dependent hydrolase